VTVEAHLEISRGLLVNILKEVTVGFTAVIEVIKEFATLGKNHRIITTFTKSHYWFPL
jgi:hypothetical protein